MNNEEKNPQQVNISIDSISPQLVNVSEVHLNVDQEVIITTEDKIRICLSDYMKKMEKKRGWITPLAIFITIIIAFSTSTFKDIGLDASTWRAIFIIAGIISFGWLILSVREAKQSIKLEDIVSELKKGHKY